MRGRYRTVSRCQRECILLQNHLREERDHLRKYLDVAEVMLVAINQKGRVTLINRKGCKILGYGEKSILGKNWFSTFIPAKHRREVRGTFERIMAGKITPVEYFENPVLTKNGERTIAWHNSYLTDSSGKITGTLSSGEDVTERKKVEEELRIHSRILDGMEEGVNVSDEKGVIFFTNPKFERMFGYNRKELIDKPVSILNDLPPTENKGLVDEIIRNLRTVGHWSGEIRNRRKDGTQFISAAKVSKLRLKGKTYFISIQDDITEQRKAGLALRESERKYRTLVNDMAEGFFIIDNKGVFTFANAALARINGCERPEQLVGKSCLDYVKPGVREGFRKMFMESFKAGSMPRVIEAAINKEDGGEAFIQVKPSIILRDGRVVGASGIVRDTTEAKHLEVLRKKLLEDLSHQLKTPLNIIEMASGLLGREVDSRRRSKEIFEMLGMIVRNTKEMRNIVSNILELSILESGDVKITKKKFDMVSTVSEVVKRMRPLADAKKLSMRVSSPRRLTLKSDEKRVSDTLSILLENAIKYTASGGVAVTLTKSKRYANLSVSDTGRGLTETQLELVFKRFYKVDASIPGVGLGLNIARETMKLLDGEITASSLGPGKGSVFNLKIPIN